MKAVAELGLEDRLSMEGSLVFLDQVKGSDAGQFRITDMQDFTVSTVLLIIRRKDGGVLKESKSEVDDALMAAGGLLCPLFLTPFSPPC